MAAASDLRQPWKDEEDEEHNHVNSEGGPSEPAWLAKRRKFLQEGTRQTSEPDGGRKQVTLAGRLTKQKPSKHSLETRFKIDKQRDANNHLKLSGGVKEIDFDPSGNLFAVLGYKEKTVKLYQVDRHHSKGHSFRLKGGMDSPDLAGRRVSSFCFTDNGSSMLIVADHRSVIHYNLEQQSMMRIASINSPSTERGYKKIYAPVAQDEHSTTDVYALSCSDNGGVLICDARSNSVIHHFQMNSQSAGVFFPPRSSAVLTADVEANVYQWDLGTGRCLHKFKDNHSLNLTSFALSQNVTTEFSSTGFLYTGSRTGYLNRFPLSSGSVTDDSGSTVVHEDLVRSYGNITTAVTSIATDEKGLFVAYASEHKRNAVRILHNPSGQVVSNWPTEKFNLGRVTAMSFCSEFNTLALGNRNGKVQFFRIFVHK